MATAYAYQVLRMLRDKMLMFWSVGFVIVLSLIFMAMFANLNESYKASAQPFGIVKDAAYDEAPGFDAFIGAISDEDAETRLINPIVFSDAESAREAAKAGEILGYVAVEGGTPELQLTTAGNDQVTSEVLHVVLDSYVQNSAKYERIMTDDPSWMLEEGILDEGQLAALLQPGEGADDELLDKLAEELALKDEGRIKIERAQVTSEEIDSTVRYYFSLLAFACGMGMNFSLVAMQDLLARSSALGARRCMAGIYRWRMLLASLAAAWTCIMICLVVAFLFIRFVVNVNFGPHQALCILALAASSLMSCTAGAVIGTVPKIKGGVVSGITALLSLFTGLYGTASQRLADLVEANAPLLSWANPLWESAHSFYSLLYYDSLEPFAQSCLAMLAMSALFFVFAMLRMRRMSHEHL